VKRVAWVVLTDGKDDGQSPHSLWLLLLVPSAGKVTLDCGGEGTE
jgi:hypothetical protein